MDTERLVEAVDWNDAPAVKAALAAGADVNARLGAGGTLLMRAAAKGRLAALRALLRGGADVNAKRDDGMTALMLASFFGHADVVSALLDCGADIDAVDMHKFTALRLASSKCHTGVIELLEHVGGEAATAACNSVQDSAAGLPHAQPELTPPVSEVAKPARAGGVKLLATGACVVVLILAGFQRTLVRSSSGPETVPAAPSAVNSSAQPVTPLAPSRGQEETAEPVNVATPAPTQHDSAAADTVKNRRVAEPVEPFNAPPPGQHSAEPALVSTAQPSSPLSETEPRRPEVKEPDALPPAEKAPAVTVLATPRDAPQSRTRQGDSAPASAPPHPSPTPKRRVIPWP